MTLQLISQTKSRFVQLTTSGLLVIQATVATIAISTFVSINSGRMSASAQETQPSVPAPGTVSISAEELKPTLAAPKPTLNVDCLLAEEMGVRPEHCPIGGPDISQRSLDPKSLKEAEEAINANRIYSPQPSTEMIHIPVVQW